MGHYLGEMEDDGIPRAWKAGRGAAHTEGQDRNWRRKLFEEIAHTKILQDRLGRFPTKQEIAALGSALNARRHRIAAISVEASRRVRAIEEEAIAEALGQADV